MVEDDNQFLEVEDNKLRCKIISKNQVTALGTELAWRVMKLWMKSAGRTLNNYQVLNSSPLTWINFNYQVLNSQAGSIQTFQWRVVANAMDSCTLPIFSKLVFQEVCR